MAEDQQLNIQANLKATADTSAIDRIIARLDEAKKKVADFERQQATLNRAAVLSGSARAAVKETRSMASEFGSDLRAGASETLKAVSGQVLKELQSLPGQTASQLSKVGITPDAVKKASQSVEGLESLGKDLSKVASAIGEKFIAPTKAKIASVESELARASGQYSGQRAKFISGQEVLPGQTAASARTQETKARGASKIGQEIAATEDQYKSAAAAKIKEARASAEKLGSSVGKATDTATKSLDQVAQAISSSVAPKGGAKIVTPKSPINQVATAVEDLRAAKPQVAVAKGGAAGGGDGSTKGAATSLNELAKAASSAATALRQISSAAKSSTSSKGGSLLGQLQKEIRSNPELAGQVHGPSGFRGAEASTNPAYAAKTAGQAAIANNNLSRTYTEVEHSSSGANQAVGSFGRTQESILGSVRQFVGLAAGYQVLQAVGNELTQIFSHLKDGIISYNSMIEQAVVGFGTLFQNQADGAYATANQVDAAGNQLSATMSDLSAKIDYIRLGYSSANEAAIGLMGTIKDFANVTPFRFAEVQEATLRMRAFGFSMDEILYKSAALKDGFGGAVVSVGNAVAALGGGATEFRRITYALGQMKQAGRVYQNDMMQLANAGIGGYKYIANALAKEISTNADGTTKKMSAQEKKLFAQLQSNAIETVRRLTTNGQISGEAAARAILAGLDKDFGGGMKRLARTFAGAFSTVADVSQSLVATAFKPFYDSVRDATVALGDFLQTPELMAKAKEFAQVIRGISQSLMKAVTGAVGIGSKIFGDISGALGKMGDTGVEASHKLSAGFGAFMQGIAAIGDLLRNDLIRQAALAFGAMKMIFAFGASNPMLSQILLVITALGILKQAYDSDFFGFKRAVDDLAAAYQPFLQTLRDEVAPLISDIGGAFAESFLAVVIEGLKLIEPALSALVTALKFILLLISSFKGPLTFFASAIALAFAGKLVLGGVSALAKRLSGLMLQFDQLTQKARAFELAAAAGMQYGGVRGQLTQTRAADGSLISSVAPGTYGAPIMIKPQAINYEGSTPGISSTLGARGFMAGLGTKASAAGMAAMIAGQIATMLGQGNKAVEEIGTVVSNVGMAVFGFSQLGAIMPAGSAAAIKNGMFAIRDGVTALIGAQMAEAALGLKKLAAALSSLPIIGGFFGMISTALSNFGSTLATFLKGLLNVGVLARTALITLTASGGAAILPAFDPNVQGSLTAPGGALAWLNESGNKKQADFGKRNNDLQNSPYLPDTGLKPTDARNVQAISAKNKSNAYDIAFVEQLLSEGNKLTEIQKSFPSYMAAFLEYRKNLRAAVDQQQMLNTLSKNNGPLISKSADAMKLLVNSQDQGVSNQKYFNWLLNEMQQRLQAATSLLQQLATSVLQDMLNPDFADPYSGLKDVGTTYEKLLTTEQEMGFTQFTNAQGTVRSFDEYKDILSAIAPLTDKDVKNGKISLKAVQERLKIEQERRKEQELSKKAAEAEYSMSLAVLQQYDQSIDPLTRAVNLNKAQKQYLEDINNLKFEGLQLIVDESTASVDWAKATAAVQKKLKEFQQGQQLVLDAMSKMFEDYNRDIADIMANPNLSAEQRKNAVQARLDKLKLDLESQFGVTATMMDAKIKQLNLLMDNVFKVVGSPTMPTINWGGSLANALEAGGYGFLTKYLNGKLVQVSNLQSKILAAVGSDTFVQQAMTKNRDQLVKLFKARLAQAGIGGIPKIPEDLRIHLGYDIASFAKSTDFDFLLTMSNKIDASLARNGLATGGMASASRPYLVGERGPELMIPQSRGLVLNNSVSSRLMGMLSGGGSSAGNVTINVNNPVIRNDDDIRKLAREISKAQASQFRTEGGRLY
jgi:hypothetical protein